MRGIPMDRLEWVTPQQIASRVQVSVQTINKEIRLGRLQAYKVGRLNRIKQEDFQAWLAMCKH